MIRLLGFFVGSATSIALILVILGVPEINFSEQLLDAETAETALQIVENEIEGFKVNAGEVLDEIKDETRNEFTDAVAGLIDELPPPEIPAEPLESVVDLAAPAEQLGADLPPVAPIDLTNGTTIGSDLKWHAFWTPFRSQIAANGFVSQLEKVTGLDYRVIKTKTAVYEVAFGYEDDAERRDNMSLIASATGLDLPQT